MLELAPGAEWALGGANVELLEPDLLLKMPNRSYLVPCKRHQGRGEERSHPASFSLGIRVRQHLGNHCYLCQSNLESRRCVFLGQLRATQRLWSTL